MLEQVAEASKAFQSSWIDDSARAMVRNDPQCSRFNPQPLEAIYHGKKIWLRFTKEHWATQLGDLRQGSNWIRSTEPGVDHTVNSLARFHELWDSTIHVSCPTAVDYDLQQYDVGHKRFIHLVNSHLRESKNPPSDLDNIATELIYYPPGGAPFPKITAPLFVGGNPYPVITGPLRLGVTSFVDLSKPSKDMLRERTSPSLALPYRSFSEGFYELDHATTGVQNNDFGTLRRIIELEKGASSDVFEAFGQKFPIGTAAALLRITEKIF